MFSQATCGYWTFADHYLFNWQLTSTSSIGQGKTLLVIIKITNIKQTTVHTENNECVNVESCYKVYSAPSGSISTYLQEACTLIFQMPSTSKLTVIISALQTEGGHQVQVLLRYFTV
jgi:hypothetical protein